MPSTQETQLRIKQTLNTDPEINFVNWEFNIQDVAANTARTMFLHVHSVNTAKPIHPTYNATYNTSHGCAR